MIKVDIEKCTGCGACKDDCFLSSISIVDDKAVFGGRCLECGHCVAICPTEAISLIGYDPDQIVDFKRIPPDETLAFLKSRRSMRQFEDREVSDDDIEKIIEAGRFAPTSGNTQLLRYIVLSKKTIDKIVPKALKVLSEVDPNTVDKAALSVPLWFLNYIPAWKGMYKLYQEKGVESLLRGAPSAVLTVSYTRSEVDGGVSTAFMDLMAHSLGIGSVYLGFLTMAFAQSPELRKEIGLKDDESVLIGLGLGYHKVKYYRTAPRKNANVTKV